MKQKLIFFPFDLFSHYLRCLKLADAVRDDYQVKFASSGDPKSNALVLQRGFEVVECKTIDAARMSLMETRLDHAWMKQEELEPVFLDQVRVLNQERPDLVISDFSITLGMAAEYAQVKCYALTIAHLSQHSRLVRKAPDSHPAIKVLKKFHCPDVLLSMMTTIGTNVEFRTMHRGIRAMRKKYGLSPRRDYLDELEAEHNLITDVEDFSPMKELPGHYTYVGPVFHQHPQSEEDLLSRLDPHKQTIFISLGTFWSSDDLFVLFNDPLFRRFNVVIAGKPGITLAPEILQRSFVNLDAVLPKTDLLICHGGDATVYQGLAHGVAMLGLPFHGEQTWSLQRLVNLDFGEEIGLPITSAALYQKICFWLAKSKQDRARFDAFASQISITATQYRFREALLQLNSPARCGFCGHQSNTQHSETINTSSDVRRFQNQYFRMWRCGACGCMHTARAVDVAPYYKDYPYDQIRHNIFVEAAMRNLVHIVASYGIAPGASILFSGALASIAKDVFHRRGFRSFDILPRPTDRHQTWQFPQKQYDMIILIDCLELTDDPRKLLDGATQCLKQRGKIFVQSPDASRIDLARHTRFKHDLHQPYRQHLLTQKIVLQMAQSNGLDVVDAQCRHFWDTLYPFVNQRVIHALDMVMDGSVDATVSVRRMKFSRWWNLPALLWIGLCGGIFKKNTTMLTVLQRSQAEALQETRQKHNVLVEEFCEL